MPSFMPSSFNIPLNPLMLVPVLGHVAYILVRPNNLPKAHRPVRGHSLPPREQWALKVGAGGPRRGPLEQRPELSEEQSQVGTSEAKFTPGGNQVHKSWGKKGVGTAVILFSSSCSVLGTKRRAFVPGSISVPPLIDWLVDQSRYWKLKPEHLALSYCFRPLKVLRLGPAELLSYPGWI